MAGHVPQVTVGARAPLWGGSTPGCRGEVVGQGQSARRRQDVSPLQARRKHAETTAQTAPAGAAPRWPSRYGARWGWGWDSEARGAGQAPPPHPWFLGCHSGEGSIGPARFRHGREAGGGVREQQGGPGAHTSRRPWSSQHRGVGVGGGEGGGPITVTPQGASWTGGSLQPQAHQPPLSGSPAHA